MRVKLIQENRVLTITVNNLGWWCKTIEKLTINTIDSFSKTIDSVENYGWMNANGCTLHNGVYLAPPSEEIKNQEYDIFFSILLR